LDVADGHRGIGIHRDQPRRLHRAAGRFAGLAALIATAALLWVPSANSQSAPSQPPRRVLELQQSFALEAVDLLITITDGPIRASGKMLAQSGTANRRGIEKQYGCKTAGTGNTWACEVPFLRGEPNWSALLRRLDSLGVMNPPSDSLRMSRAGRPGYLCLDGTPWALIVKDVAGEVLVEDGQSCGPIGPVRARFEAGIEAVLHSVDTRASFAP